MNQWRWNVRFSTEISYTDTYETSFRRLRLKTQKAVKR